MVSRCRFVFEYSDVSDEEKQGTLYFTDSHYGEDKIPKETLFKKACYQMSEDFFAKFAKKLKNDQYELIKILQLLNDPQKESMDAVNHYFQKFEEFLKKIMSNSTHVAMQTRIRKLKKNLLAMDYFELFEKATKLRSYKYNLQEYLLEDLHKELVNRLNKELDNNLQMLLNQPSQLKSFLNETKLINRHLKAAVSIVLEESVQYLKTELAQTNLQQLLNNWKGLEQKFDEKLKMLAQNQKLQLSNDEEVRVRMVYRPFETVKNRLIDEGFYPFVEIGVTY